MEVRVLLVDEERDTRTSLTRRLANSAAIKVDGTAGTIAEVREFLQGERPTVILLALHRRDGRELELCRAVRALTDRPLVVLASFMTPERWEAAQGAGASHYLLKRLDTEQIAHDLALIAQQAAGNEGAPCGPPLDGSSDARGALP